MQKEKLFAVVDELVADGDPVRYLDFACGSGRILTALEDRVNEAVGLDISEEMISIARDRVRRAALVQGDITQELLLEGRKFELITAFRFILNAEPSLRLSAMKEVASRLASPRSVLVFTNHGNLLSHKLLLSPLHLSRRGRKYDSRQGNYLTHWQIERLVEAAGLQIDAVYGYGLLSARALTVASYESLRRWEAVAAGTPGLHRLGCDQMYVARLARHAAAGD
jgi:SAM-dependent methyltransferase